MGRKQKGFSLIELLIVVAIILIIAAIAIPNLLRSKMAANEASAVGSLRSLNTACITYSTTYGSYPAGLSNLGPGSPATSTTADLIDSVPASGTKSGYSFTFGRGGQPARHHYGRGCLLHHLRHRLLLQPQQARWQPDPGRCEQCRTD